MKPAIAGADLRSRSDCRRLVQPGATIHQAPKRLARSGCGHREAFCEHSRADPYLRRGGGIQTSCFPSRFIAVGNYLNLALSRDRLRSENVEAPAMGSGGPLTRPHATRIVKIELCVEVALARDGGPGLVMSHQLATK